MMWTKYSDARFKKTLGIPRAKFQFVLQLIRHALDRDTVIEEPLSSSQRRLLLYHSRDDRARSINGMYHS